MLKPAINALIVQIKKCILFFYLVSVIRPGSYTAAERSLTSKSCTSPMLSLYLAIPLEEHSGLEHQYSHQSPKTLPKKV